jgi:hypothetical protein
LSDLFSHISINIQLTLPYFIFQVDVDEAAIQNKLGKLNMDFVRKAERINLDRAKRHK